MCIVPVAIASLSREQEQDTKLVMAGSVVTVVPVLILFLGLPRFYLQGLSSAASKVERTWESAP